LIFAFFLLWVNEKKDLKAAGVISFITSFCSLFVVAFLSHFLSVLNLIATTFWSFVSISKKFRSYLCFSTVISFLILLCWYFLFGKNGMQSMSEKGSEIYNILSPDNHTTLLTLIQGMVSIFNSMNGFIFQYLGFRNRDFFYFGLIPLAIIIIGFITIKPKIRLVNEMFLYLNIIVPIFYLSLLAIWTKHNTMFLPRYIIFVIPFYTILFAVAIRSIFENQSIYIKVLATILIIIQVGLNVCCYKVPFEGKIIYYNGVKSRIENDKMLQSPPVKNMYAFYAKHILREYKSGQIVVYNSARTAQFTNLYLPRNSKDILQTIDSTQFQDFNVKYQ